MQETISNYKIYLFNLLTNKESYQLFLLLLILVLIVGISDYLFRFIITIIFKKINEKSSFDWYVLLYKKKIFTSIAHFFSFGLGLSISHILLHDFKWIIIETDKVFSISITLFFFQLIFKLIDLIGVVVNKDQETYKTVAYRTFSQFLKIITILLGFIIIISLLFNLNLNTIITGISAITAILLLIFKDTIVGFVSGIQISTTKILKVGDVISIEKFNLEGIVKEINLTSTKIENFDKSFSFIPTYDLLSSKIINHQSIIDLDLKKMKRTIFFNINSICYLEPEKINLLIQQFPLLTIINEDFNNRPLKSFSNLELFTNYLDFYLKNHQKISKRELVLIKVLPIINHTIPIQISCFCNSSKVTIYEPVISEILIHALITSKKFELELIDKEN
ncbi:MAG: mechanosensitive ion channel family protein [Solirubrobacteraceae bacterium]